MAIKAREVLEEQMVERQVCVYLRVCMYVCVYLCMYVRVHVCVCDTLQKVCTHFPTSLLMAVLQLYVTFITVLASPLVFKWLC